MLNEDGTSKIYANPEKESRALKGMGMTSARDDLNIEQGQRADSGATAQWETVQQQPRMRRNEAGPRGVKKREGNGKIVKML